MRRLPPQRASPTFPRSSAILQPAELPCRGRVRAPFHTPKSHSCGSSPVAPSRAEAGAHCNSRLAGVRHLQGSHPPTGAGSSVNPVG